MEKHQYFEYMEKGQTIYFQKTEEGGFICWKFGQKNKSMVRHIQFKKSCRGSFDIDQFKQNFKEFRIDKTKKETNARVKNSIV